MTNPNEEIMTSDIDRELLPCPFCGGRPHYSEEPDCHIVCFNPECDLMDITFKDSFRNFDKMVKSWNTRANPQWQDISTAPKDETEVLIYADSEVISAYWSESIWAKVANPKRHQSGGWVKDVNRSDTYVYTPTHWMPLPKAPS